eukprot:TRINITY_DN110942_c0_g1_i1.p1 TRINITY_DN110942_c0_g1~~TRINITY_DN110942_c0_g1_i1.p1  ORF type:complete len:579 (+),score=197.76 TRINITY_DN110942_c0_g1_i1:149-1885(+)
MNNDSFRKLLATDDHALVKELTQRPAKSNKKANDPRAEKYKKIAKEKGKGKGKGGAIGDAKAKEPEYRDRAAERREGQGEYEVVAAEWENHNEVSAEQSKYLGGDLDHTHLVKGLDFALLSKVRNEINKQQRAEDLHKQRAEKKQKKRSFETVLAKKVWHTVVETLHPHHKTFKGRLDGMTKAISMGQRIRGAPSVFLPGRMEYEFDITEEQAQSDIPRIIYISKEDAQRADLSQRPGCIMQDSINKVRDSMKRAAEARKARKNKETLGAQASYTVAQKIVAPAKTYKAKDADDDIFGGAGGFDSGAFAAKEKAKLDAKRKSSGAENAAASSKAKAAKESYFADAGAKKYTEGVDVHQLDLADVATDERDADTGKSADSYGAKGFQPSERFRGARPGWVFKTGDHGLGYYLDDAKLAAQHAKKQQESAALLRGGTSERTSLRKAKADMAKGKEVVDEDAYDECFPNAMSGHALVTTGEDGSDDEDESAKKKIERLKKLAEKSGKPVNKDALDSSQYGKKGKEQDAKKRKMNENQQWQKIDQMIKKGKHGSFEELEAQGYQGQKAKGRPKDIMATPAFF